MKRTKMRIVKLILLLAVICIANYLQACTIFSVKDKDGNVWAANNEDGNFTFTNYINVFPKTANTKYGYYTLSYESKENGTNGNIQGGMNEAGLFYDFNAISETEIIDFDKKKAFPQGDDKVLSHILANFSTTQEVVDFFDQYWFQRGFNSAQLHVTDKQGNFAIIGPSGTRVLNNEKFQVSTNFDICGEEDGGTCWRFPIVERELKRQKINSKTLANICEQTAPKGTTSHTIYSNVQNLNTGEIWFYFISDYKNAYKTSISELVAKGRKSYLIRDLFPNHPLTVLYKEYQKNGGIAAYEHFQSLKLDEDRQQEIASIFVNTVLDEHYDIETLPFLEDHLKSDPVGHWMRSARAIFYYQNGDTEKAITIVKDYKTKVPETSMKVDLLLDLFDGKFPADANVTVSLSGYEDAKQVFIKGLPAEFKFLIKKDGKWVGKYKLPVGVHNYVFVVDGKEVFDSQTPVESILPPYGEVFFAHQACVGMSEQSYMTTITVTVPNKDDVVYIAGNQLSVTNWYPYVQLDKVSDYERSISLPLHYPAQFKFTRGNWDTEGIIKGNTNNKEGEWLPLSIDLKSSIMHYEILHWKDQLDE